MRFIVTTVLAASAVTAALLVVVGGEHTAVATPLNDCHSSDNGDPRLTSISVSPGVVDVRSAPARVDITATAHDTGGPGPATGVRSINAEVLQGGEYTQVRLTRDPTGTWTGSLTIPQGARAGRLRIDQVMLHDRAGQPTWYGFEDIPLSSVQGRHVVTVTSLVDKTPPRLTAFSFTPHAVDTTHRARRVVVTARAHDPRTGVRAVSAWFSGPQGGHSRLALLQHVRGSRDLFRGPVVIPRYVTSARWRVGGVAVENGASTFAWYSHRRLGRLGFDRHLRVRSSRDRWLPTLHGLRRTPAAVDVRTHDQQVTVTARLRDRGAGIRSADVGFYERSTPTIRLHRVAGSRYDGTWSGHMTVRRCHAPGATWRIVVSADDRRGHHTHFSAGTLARRGMPSTVHVTAMPPATPPRLTVERHTQVPTGRVTVHFARGVSGIDTGSAPVRRASVDDETRPSGPALVGTWTCRTRTGVLTSCAAGAVRSAVFRPSNPFAVHRAYLLELNPEHTLQVTDARGNPYDRQVEYFRVM